MNLSGSISVLAIGAEQDRRSHSERDNDNTTTPLCQVPGALTAHGAPRVLHTWGVWLRHVKNCAVHFPSVGVWLSMPGTAHGLSFDHAALAVFWSTHVIVLQPPVLLWFCFDLGAQQLEWKAAGCSPWCPPAFEVFVVVVCQSQPRGFDWHRFYVFSLCISDMCRCSAAQSACYLLHKGVRVASKRGPSSQLSRHSTAKWQNWLSYFSEGLKPPARL